MRYAVVHSGVIENVVIWDGEEPWVPPLGVDLHPLEDGVVAGIGWAWGENGPVQPPPREDVEQPPEP